MAKGDESGHILQVEQGMSSKSTGNATKKLPSWKNLAEIKVHVYLDSQLCWTVICTCLTGSKQVLICLCC